jgi:hypothetical protein
MEAALIVGIIFFSMVAVVKIISDTVTRRKLIDKGLADERIGQVFGVSEIATLANLKWGMVLVGVGLAAFISQYLPYYLEEEGAIGLMLIFAGIAFLIYFPIAQRRLRQAERRKEGSAGQ